MAAGKAKSTLKPISRTKIKTAKKVSFFSVSGKHKIGKGLENLYASSEPAKNNPIKIKAARSKSRPLQKNSLERHTDKSALAIESKKSSINSQKMIASAAAAKKTAVQPAEHKKNVVKSVDKSRTRKAPRAKVKPAMMEFPKTKWGTDSVVSFEPTEQLPPLELTSVVGGFVFYNDKLVVANIPGRGWEIIGGRIDVGETPEDTFCREAMNQVGVTLSHLKMIGVVRIEHLGPEPPNCPYPYPVGYGVQYIGIVDELLPFTGGPDSLGRSLITTDGFKEHYFEWNEYYDAVFRYAYSIYTKWRKKLKL